MNAPTKWAALATLLLCLPCGTAKAQPVDIEQLLIAQNRYRAEVGVPPLWWSEALAHTAQQWADHLAQINQMIHSGALHRGENLAMVTAGNTSLSNLVDLWGAEKNYFVHQTFPSVSSKGSWKVVGHYSQLVCKAMAEVGCGLSPGGGNGYLVCQYDPQGNIFGQQVYRRPRRWAQDQEFFCSTRPAR